MPTPEVMQRQWGLTPHAALHASRLLALFPTARPTSGYRTPAHNREVGGVPGSFHVKRRALDVVVPLRYRRQFIQTAWRQRVTPRCTGPEEVIDEGDHVHLAW